MGPGIAIPADIQILGNHGIAEAFDSFPIHREGFVEKGDGANRVVLLKVEEFFDSLLR